MTGSHPQHAEDERTEQLNDEAYWQQLFDDAYRMQLETPDEESDVDVEVEP